MKIVRKNKKSRQLPKKIVCSCAFSWDTGLDVSRRREWVFARAWTLGEYRFIFKKREIFFTVLVLHQYTF